MSVNPWFGCLTFFIVLGLPSYIYSADRVSAVVCSNGGTECGTGTNAVCDVPKLKCKCNDGYVEDSNDGSTCVQRTSNQQVTKDLNDEQLITRAVRKTATSTIDRVSAVVCSEGGTECGTNTNAACDDPKLKCKCNDGYVEDSNDGSTCVLSTSNQQVTKVVCSDGGTECNAIVHAACDVPHLKCKCDAGYVEDKTDTSKCVKILGSDCTGASACVGDSNSVCKSSKCKCADNFGEKNNVCKASLDSKTCTAQGTECKSPPHAECDTAAKKCRCSEGFKMNVDTCEVDNAGVSITLAVTILAIPVVLAMKKAFENLM